MKKKAQFGNAITYIILIVVSIIWIFPIIWIVLTSFRGESGQFVSYFIPHEFTADNYKVLFTNSDYPFLRWFGNTFIVAVFSCIISTILTTSMAYVLSGLRFRMRKPIMKIALVLNMFPAFMSMIAVYYILKAMNLTQSLAALVLVYSAGSALTFYVSKGFFDTMPKALDESAQIDGATKFQIFTKITFPLAKPIIVYTSLTAFMSPWMDFIFSKVIMGDNVQNYTIAIGLYTMMTKANVNTMFTVFTAGCVIIAIPISLLFIYMQKFYVEGVTSGAVKG